MAKNDILKKAMIEALEQSLGIVTTACKMVGIARETHYRWTREDENYKKAVESISDMTIDFAESQLHKQIKEGSTAATIFFLKTKGKQRGYVERIEHKDLSMPDFSDMTNEEILEILKNEQQTE